MSKLITPRELYELFLTTREYEAVKAMGEKYHASTWPKENLRKKPRSKEQHALDCLNGVALQFAVLEALQRAGFIATMAPDSDWWYDIILELNGEKILVDVKGRFRFFGELNFEQSKPEMLKINQLSLDVLYFCVDCRNADEGFIHMGEEWHSRLSKTNRDWAGNYVWANNLREIL